MSPGPKLSVEATVIDYYLPEHIFTYDDEGLRQLVEGADLTYQKLPFPSSARGRRDAGG